MGGAHGLAMGGPQCLVAGGSQCPAVGGTHGLAVGGTHRPALHGTPCIAMMGFNVLQWVGPWLVKCGTQCSGGTMDGLGMGGVHGIAMGGTLCGHGWDTHCLVMGWDTWSCNGWSWSPCGWDAHCFVMGVTADSTPCFSNLVWRSPKLGDLRA